MIYDRLNTEQNISFHTTSLRYAGENTSCAEGVYSNEEWMGLIEEMGNVRVLSQRTAVEFILLKEFNVSSATNYAEQLLEMR